MQTVTVSEFRAHFGAIFNKIAATGEPVILTKRGKPLFQLESAGYAVISQDPPLASVRVPCIRVGRPVGWHG